MSLYSRKWLPFVFFTIMVADHSHHEVVAMDQNFGRKMIDCLGSTILDTTVITGGSYLISKNFLYAPTKKMCDTVREYIPEPLRTSYNSVFGGEPEDLAILLAVASLIYPVSIIYSGVDLETDQARLRALPSYILGLASCGAGMGFLVAEQEASVAEEEGIEIINNEQRREEKLKRLADNGPFRMIG